VAVEFVREHYDGDRREGGVVAVTRAAALPALAAAQLLARPCPDQRGTPGLIPTSATASSTSPSSTSPPGGAGVVARRAQDRFRERTWRLARRL